MLSRTIAPCSIMRVQSWDVDANVPSAIDQVVKAEWPREVGAIVSGPVDVLCIGPTDWLVIAEDTDGDELYRTLETALIGSALRVTDVSQALARIEVEGPEAREFLLQGCSLDLHPDRFPAGRCARIRFAGIPIVLRCRDASSFEEIVPASYRDYLLAWIADASDPAFAWLSHEKSS